MLFFFLFSVANRTSVGSHPAEKPCTLYCNNTGHLFIQQGVVFLWYSQLASEEPVGQRLGCESKEKRKQNPASEGGKEKKRLHLDICELITENIAITTLPGTSLSLINLNALARGLVLNGNQDQRISLQTCPESNPIAERPAALASRSG